MAKNKSSRNDDNQHFGDDIVEDKFEHSKVEEENSYPASSSEKVTLVFKQNRKKELHIGKETFIFEGAGSKNEMDRKLLDHPDFDNQAKYFLIKEK